MENFFRIHKGLQLEGPGNNQSTKRAFKMVRNLTPDSKILDIGCGPGRQTIELAKNARCNITAIDNHQPYLENLKRKAEEEDFSDKITIVNASMLELNLEPKSFDLIWSEGAIYIIGFEKGLREWKKYLKEDGYMVVSELSWLTSERPEEPKKFWESAYAQMKCVNENLKIADACNYSVAGVFILPKSGWDEYYLPLEKRIAMLKTKDTEDETFQKALDTEIEEIELYRKYGDYYGYVFYILRANK